MSRKRTTLGTLATLGAAASLTAGAAAASHPQVTSLKANKSGGKVTVTAKTKDFRIDAKGVGKKPKAGRGHLHFQMDGGRYDYPKYSGANGKIAKQLGVQGKYSPSVNGKVTYKGLPKGRHKVTVFLVRNDHSNYPGAKRTIRFRVN